VFTLGLMLPILIFKILRTPRTFDTEGMILTNRSKFLWVDLRRIEFVDLRGRYSAAPRRIGVNLTFSNGTVYVPTRSLLNEREVLEFIAFPATPAGKPKPPS
jgi:hypothetical protein